MLSTRFFLSLSFNIEHDAVKQVSRGLKFHVESLSNGGLSVGGQNVAVEPLCQSSHFQCPHLRVCGFGSPFRMHTGDSLLSPFLPGSKSGIAFWARKLIFLSPPTIMVSECSKS